MEFASEDIRPWLETAWAFLTSLPAQRGYALAGGAGLLAACIYLAIRADNAAEGNIKDAEKDFAKRWPGRPPTTTDGVEKRREYYRQIERRIRDQALRTAAVSFIFGAVVPSIMLLVMTIHYGWFDSQGGHLLDALGEPTSSIRSGDAVVFVLDQALRGGLFDLLEVFDFEIALIDNNPASLWFSIGVFAYHLVLEAFIFSGLFLLTKTIWRLRQLRLGLHVLLRSAPPADPRDLASSHLQGGMAMSGAATPHQP